MQHVFYRVTCKKRATHTPSQKASRSCSYNNAIRPKGTHTQHKKHTIRNCRMRIKTNVWVCVCNGNTNKFSLSHVYARMWKCYTGNAFSFARGLSLSLSLRKKYNHQSIFVQADAPPPVHFIIFTKVILWAPDFRAGSMQSKH